MKINKNSVAYRTFMQCCGALDDFCDEPYTRTERYEDATNLCTMFQTIFVWTPRAFLFQSAVVMAVIFAVFGLPIHFMGFGGYAMRRWRCS